jgi:hypothetical protein
VAFLAAGDEAQEPPPEPVLVHGAASGLTMVCGFGSFPRSWRQVSQQTFP